jgi:acetyl esterase/lipase
VDRGRGILPTFTHRPVTATEHSSPLDGELKDETAHRGRRVEAGTAREVLRFPGSCAQTGVPARFLGLKYRAQTDMTTTHGSVPGGPPARRRARATWLVAVMVLVFSGCGATAPSPATTASFPVAASPSPIASFATSSPFPTGELGSPSPPVLSQPPATPFYFCGEADPSCLSLAVVQQQGIALTTPVACGAAGTTCVLHVDTFAPPTTKRLPVVVMIPGGPSAPGSRGYLWTLARLVAWRGAVVFTADYRSDPQFGGGYPQTLGDVGCAIRFARARAAALGGDPSRVTLVAHSFGGFPGSVMALSARDFASDDPECVVPLGDGRPDAFIGLGAIYGLDHIGQDFLGVFLGGTRDEVPGAWNATDIAVLASAPGHRRPIVGLIAGTADRVAPVATADEFAGILRGASINVTVTSVEGADHDAILSRPLTIDTVAALIGASGY